MIPETVRFTELELDPRELLYRGGRKWDGAWPTTWTRHQFVVPNAYDDPLPKFDRWMAKNIQGRWGSYSVSIKPGERIICVAFEIFNEAIMFRLKEGEIVWREEDEE